VEKAFYYLFCEHLSIFGKMPVLTGEQVHREPKGIYRSNEGIRRICLYDIFCSSKFASKLNTMRIHLDKDTSIISITIAVAFLLLFSIFQGQAQGQSCSKAIIIKKAENSYEYYNVLLKTRYYIPKEDSVKKKPVQDGQNTRKKIKKGVSYMLISGQDNEKYNYITPYKRKTEVPV